MLTYVNSHEYGRGMARLGLILVAALVLTACNTAGYAFKVDESIDITAPEDRATVELPVTVRWLDTTPPATPRVAPSDPTSEYYAVFVDRAPLGPGRRIASLVDENDSCRRTPGCPDDEFLARLKVFLTAKPDLTLEFLADLRPTERAGSKDPHEVTVVRMRGDRRVGEAAFRVTFFVDRSS